MEQVELQVAETEREEATSRWKHFFNVAGKVYKTKADFRLLYSQWTAVSLHQRGNFAQSLIRLSNYR